MIDWKRAAEWASLSDEEVYRRAKLERALAIAGRAQDDAQSHAVAPATDPPPRPDSGEKTQGLAPRAGRRGDSGTTAPAPKEPTVTATAPDPVDVLSTALDAAADDTERAALLAAAPRPLREQLSARLRYRQFVRSAEDDPYVAFERELDACNDDSARRVLIAGKDAGFLLEWSWRVRASAEGWQRRYLEMIDEPGAI
jgi:hypothetical protein